MSYPGSSGGANYLKGFNNVMSNLNMELEKIKGKSEKGLVMAAAFIRKQTETADPKTPVDLGNLRHSWAVVSSTRVYAGNTRSAFVGPKGGDIGTNHGQVLTQFQALAQGLSNGNQRKVVVLGYSVNYGGYVHEMIGDITWTRKGSNSHWLETHIKRNQKKLLQIIATEVKIRK